MKTELLPEMRWPHYTDDDIVARRPAKHAVDPMRPYAYLVELEHTAARTVEPVATLFLTNRECPFRCLMCDLWRHTTDTPTPAGAIPTQIAFALKQLPPARHVKLYNSGNFFDTKAIPPADYVAIARLVAGFETVIVENHPNLCHDAVLRFRDLVNGRLEIALGLETAHPLVLERLNKRMTLDDFDRAAAFLSSEGIAVRAFILVKPPFLNEEEGIAWAVRSMRFAFDAGVQCCSLVPTRSGNGIMQALETTGHFSPPALSSMETVLEAGLRMQRGRVFLDVWDVERFFEGRVCAPVRAERLRQMNLTQRVQPPVACMCPDCNSENTLGL